MSTLSIRKLPPELEKALQREVSNEGITKTEIVLQALREKFHQVLPVRNREKIRKFFGKMPRSDYKTFQETTGAFSEIDESLWK